MMGFLPGLPYLGSLPAEFELPRRENPRLRVPPGSIAIAMAMTTIYPLESPGGWNLLGRTPVADVGSAPRRAVTAGCRRQGDVRTDIACESTRSILRASRRRHLRAAARTRGPAA